MRRSTLVALGKRLAQLVVSLFVLLCITFFIGRVLPTDPVGAIVGELADPAAYEAMRARLGLDLPVWQQFWIYLTNLLRGDLGQAILTGNQVTDDLALAFPATFELATFAIVLSAAIGVPLGLAAAVFRDSWIDRFARVVSLIGHSVPVFWFGIIGLVVFYATLNLVGGPGRLEVYNEGLVPSVTGLMLVDSLLAGDMEVFWDAVSHIILPASILAYSAMAYITRMTRSFALEQLGQDYVIAARAKGLTAPKILRRHVMPNIAVQLVTVLALSYGALLEGAVVTEIVFSWPGIGQYVTNALMIGDMNAVLACTLVIGFIFMILNFVADTLYTVLDPRTREVRA